MEHLSERNSYRAAGMFIGAGTCVGEPPYANPTGHRERKGGSLFGGVTTIFLKTIIRQVGD